MDRVELQLQMHSMMTVEFMYVEHKVVEKLPKENQQLQLEVKCVNINTLFCIQDLTNFIFITIITH